MLKYQNIKVWLIFILLFVGFINLNATDINTTNINSKNVNIINIGDKIYVILGEGSNARVESGSILKVGKSNSRVRWDSCSDCQRWVANSTFYYSLSKANKVTEQMDLEDMSMSDCRKKTILDRGVLELMNSLINSKEYVK